MGNTPFLKVKVRDGGIKKVHSEASKEAIPRPKEQNGEETNTIVQNEARDPQEVKEDPVESSYVHELDKLLDEYTHFVRAYQELVRFIKNPLRLRKKAGELFQRLLQVGESFNERIISFKENAVPPEEMKELHDDLIQTLEIFKNYNNEFPGLVKSGNVMKIFELTKDLEKGQRGLQLFFNKLEERENKKNEQKERAPV